MLLQIIKQKIDPNPYRYDLIPHGIQEKTRQYFEENV